MPAAVVGGMDLGPTVRTVVAAVLCGIESTVAPAGSRVTAFPVHPANTKPSPPASSTRRDTDDDTSAESRCAAQGVPDDGPDVGGNR